MSNQTTTKDNSAVVEDSGINAADGSTAVRDDGTVAGGNATRGNLFGVGGDLDVGNDNQISVESADAETSQKALEEAGDTSREAIRANADVSDDAFGFGQATVEEAVAAIRANNDEAFDFAGDTTREAFDANREITDDSFDFSEAALREVGENSETLAGVLDEALGFAEVSQEAANQLSRDTNRTLATKSSDADSAVSATLQKNILIGTGIIAAALVVSRLPNS